MIQSVPKELAMRFDETIGWIVDVPHALSPQQLDAIRNYALKINTERWRSLPHGDNRDRMERGLLALKQGKIQQKINKKGEIDLYKSTEAKKTTLYYH